MFKTTLPLALLAPLGTVSAQVAPGDSARFTIGGVPAVGIELIDVDGSGDATQVGPLTPAARGANDGVIDPITGQLWTVGVNVSAYGVMRITLDGASVTNEEIVANLTAQGTGTGFSSIDLDRDGNAFVCDNNEIWKIDRHSGVVTQWTVGTSLGELNAIAIDRATNTMWTGSLSSVFTPGAEVREYDLDAGPSAGVQVLDLLAAGVPNAVGGMTYGDDGWIYVGAWDGLYRLDPDTGATQVLPVNVVMNPQFGTTNEFNSIDYDSVNGLLHTSGGIFADGVYWTIDVATHDETLINSDYFCEQSVTEFCFDVPVAAGVAVNDFLYSTQVFPRVASKSAGFTLETAAQGQPGDTALAAVIEVNGALIQPILLGDIGVCGPGGNDPNELVIAPGELNPLITSIGVVTATFDVGSGQWILGDIVTVTLGA